MILEQAEDGPFVVVIGNQIDPSFSEALVIL